MNSPINCDPLRVGVTRDVLGRDGRPLYPLDLLDATASVAWEYLPEERQVLTAADVDEYDAVIVEHPHVTADTLDCSSPPILLARTGVGVDRVDLEACTAAGVIVTTTPESVRRPMAAGAMAFMLALSHCLPQRERRLRAGEWSGPSRVGKALTGRTLGVLGAGNIGRDLCRLAAPFEMRILAHDPFVKPFAGAELVELDTLLGESDFLVVTCPLNDQTRHLLDAARIAQMKPDAYLINVARGGIVEQKALAEALREGRLAGAALDVFEQEPVDPEDPLFGLDNVIMTPHAIGTNDEAIALTGQIAAAEVVAVAGGSLPSYIINREVLDHPRVRSRFET
ncbi:MAG: NAD(P)-dependent oxidoreductase [Nocardioides sp.]|uniref:NAD(P)-dependent oxidoreductase n=1 Tax=Nocardioides sp. TaxID=35761 RepID=UPI0039E54FC6